MSDSDLLRVLQLVHELTEQLSYNQKITHELQEHAKSLKTQAGNSVSGFDLRRFNTDLSKEVFESELERTNAQIVIENQILLHENRQLSVLLKEYEGTMDTIMSKFRNHAVAAQQHELTLTRHYEGLLLARYSHISTNDFSLPPNTKESLRRLAHNLGNLLRSMAGDNSDAPAPIDMEDMYRLLDALDKQGPGYPGLEGRQDWAIERECEIERLQHENDELRRLLGIDPDSLAESGIDMEAEIARMERPRHPELSERSRSAAAQAAGQAAAAAAAAAVGENSYWEGNGAPSPTGPSPLPQQPIFQPPISPNTANQFQQPPPPGGPSPQRMDLPRMLQGNRRTGMFGAGAQTPRNPSMMGNGRGGPNNQPPLWSNQPPSPAVPLTQDRPWT